MDLILTSKLGTFVFDKRVILSKAKLIRDAITGQFFHPRVGEPRITAELSAQNYALTQLDRNLADIPFDLRMHDDLQHRSSKAARLDERQSQYEAEEAEKFAFGR